MSVGRRCISWTAGPVLVAVLVLGTVPFLLAGHSTRTVIEEQLPGLVASAGIPIALRALDYSLGVYTSSFVLQLEFRSNEQGTLRAIVLHGTVDHGFLSSNIKVILDPQSLAAAVPELDINPPSPAIRIHTRMNLGLPPQWGKRLRGDVHIEPLQLSSRLTPLQASVTAIDVDFEQAARGIDATMKMASFQFTNGQNLHSTFSLVRGRIRSRNAASGDDDSIAAQSHFGISLRVAESKSQGRLAFVNSKSLQLNFAIDLMPDAVKPSLTLQADEVSSQGVPYLKLTALHVTVTGEIKSPAKLAKPAKSQFEFHHEARSQSNFGLISSNGNIRITNPRLTRSDLLRDSSANLMARVPTGLLNLLLDAQPGLRDRWRKARILEEHDSMAEIKAHWENGQLIH